MRVLFMQTNGARQDLRKNTTTHSKTGKVGSGHRNYSTQWYSIAKIKVKYTKISNSQDLRNLKNPSAKLLITNISITQFFA